MGLKQDRLFTEAFWRPSVGARHSPKPIDANDNGKLELALAA